MEKFDLSAVLQSHGVEEDAANRLKGRLLGQDYMKLVDLLKVRDLDGASKILGKYGVRFGSHTMSDNYLKAKYESLRTGDALDETFGVMTRIAESFTYAVEVSEQNRDRVLDWLDENQLVYQATSPTNYHIECGDRDVAYRTGRALSEILRKPTVRDSVEIEEKMSKNPDKRAKNAKEKMADIKPRNPIVAAVKTRSGAGAHDGGKDPRKQDKFGRGAKHKPRFDEEIESNLAEAEVSHLEEGVMGMTKVNPLFRLRELAGLPSIEEDDFEGIEVAELPVGDEGSPLAPGPVAEPAVDGVGTDPVADPMPDMDGGSDIAVDDLDGMGDLDGGVPGDLPPEPVEPVPDLGMDNVDQLGGVGLGVAPTAPTQSEAMAEIEDGLNNIQSKLADIRLSEYKSLIQKLQDLTNQAQMMGRDYLGERRKK